MHPNLPHHKDIKYAFNISRIDKKKTYVLIAKSEESKLLWIRAFDTVKQARLSIRQTVQENSREEDEKVAFKVMTDTTDAQLRQIEIQTSMEGVEVIRNI